MILSLKNLPRPFSPVHGPAPHVDPAQRPREPGGRRPRRPRPRARAGERVGQQDQGIHQGRALIHGKRFYSAQDKDWPPKEQLSC